MTTEKRFCVNHITYFFEWLLFRSENPGVISQRSSSDSHDSSSCNNRTFHQYLFCCIDCPFYNMFSTLLKMPTKVVRQVLGHLCEISSWQSVLPHPPLATGIAWTSDCLLLLWLPQLNCNWPTWPRFRRVLLGRSFRVHYDDLIIWK